jgi:hypothetical protein
VVSKFGAALGVLPASHDWVTAALRETAVIDMMEL